MYGIVAQEFRRMQHAYRNLQEVILLQLLPFGELATRLQQQGHRLLAKPHDHAGLARCETALNLQVATSSARSAA